MSEIQKPKCQQPQGYKQKVCVCCILWDERYDEKVKALEDDLSFHVKRKFDYMERSKNFERQNKVLEDKILKYSGRPCECDPLFSGEEYCNGGCELTQKIKALDSVLNTKNIAIKSFGMEVDELNKNVNALEEDVKSWSKEQKLLCDKNKALEKKLDEQAHLISGGAVQIGELQKEKKALEQKIKVGEAYRNSETVNVIMYKNKAWLLEEYHQLEMNEAVRVLEDEIAEFCKKNDYKGFFDKKVVKLALDKTTLEVKNKALEDEVAKHKKAFKNISNDLWKAERKIYALDDDNIFINEKRKALTDSIAEIMAHSSVSAIWRIANNALLKAEKKDCKSFESEAVESEPSMVDEEDFVP